MRIPFLGRRTLVPLASCLWLVWAAATAWAQQAPPNDMFQNATVLPNSGYGTVLGSNVGATSEFGEPSHAGFAPSASIWYQWTAPQDGEVTLDTLGSTNFMGENLDTVVAVYTGPFNLSQLMQVAANDDYFPLGDKAYIYSTRTAGAPTGNPMGYSYPPLFFGPSILRFNATAGTTYYIAVDSKASILTGQIPGGDTGTIVLNWAYHPSGAFRFASEEFDFTHWTNGMPRPMFQCTETESMTDWDSTSHSYYQYDPEGVLVTVTRVAGSCGRMFVDYTTQDGTALAGYDYQPASGTLVFDDFEMSKTIVIPIIWKGFYVSDGLAGTFPPDWLDKDFSVVLSNARRAPLESTNVPQPRLDGDFATATVHILSQAGLGSDPNEDWHGDGGNTAPSDDVYNFLKKNFRVPRDVNDYHTTVLISVERTHDRTASHNANDHSATIHYRVNGTLANSVPPDEYNNFFALNPGSDYAIPNPADACPWIYPWFGPAQTTWTNYDFTLADGTVTVPAVGYGTIRFTVNNDDLTKFNRDFQITLYRSVNNHNVTVGEVSECRVTILFDDTHPPAGSVDEFHNADYGVNMKPPVATTPSNRAHPGADGTVWGLAMQPDSKVVLVGEFSSYNGTNCSCIARALPSGDNDPTFTTGYGAGGGMISSVALLPDDSGSMMIGGTFTHYNSADRKYIARLTSNGLLDSTFNPTQDPDGPVWALAIQDNNQVIIAGDFTHIGLVPRAHIARLNADGSLDTSFDPGANAPDDTIWSVALQPDGKVVIGGRFQWLGDLPLSSLARLNPDGSADTAFDDNLGLGVDGEVKTVVIQNGTSIVIGGEFHQVGIAQRTRIARLNADGTVDDTFNSGSGADDTIYNIAAQPDGSMYVGGIFTSYNGTHRLGFTRLYADGTVDTTFLDTAYNQFAGLHRKYYERQPWPAGSGPDPNPDPRPYVYASQVQPDGGILIGGSFKQVGGGQATTNCFDADYPVSVIDNNLWIEPKSRDGVRNRSNFARLIGGSTPGPGNIGFLYNAYAQNKSQGSLDVDLVRTNGTLGYASANFAALAGLAQSGADYIYNSAPPIYLGSWWPSTQLTPFYADTIYSVTRDHSDGFSGTNEIPVDIYGHNWFGYNPGKITLTLKNSGVPGDVDTKIQLANPSGADEFFLGGQNVPLGNALGVSSAPLVLVDNNRNEGVIGFASASFSVTENGTNATVVIVRTNGTAGSPSFILSTSDGTAHAGSNYVAFSQRINFQPGQATLTKTIRILDDGISEPNGLNLNLQISSLQSGNGSATYGLANATLNIVDSDYAPGYLVFSSAAYTNLESRGAAVLTVNRIGSTKGTVTVCCTNAALTALPGVNYTPAGTNFAWNDGDASPRYFVVPLIRDGLVGPNTVFSNYLYGATVDAGYNNTPVLASSPVSATVTIVDDDYYGSLQFSEPQYVVDENGGYATITVIRTSGAAESLNVGFTTADGTAVSSGVLKNYFATNGTLSFAAGQVATNFTVQLKDDGIYDNLTWDQFYFLVQLTTLSPTNATFGYPTIAKVCIRDANNYAYPAGSPDTSFVPNPGFNGDVSSLALQPDGKIVAAGSFTTLNSYPRNRIARLNSDATIDTAFLDGFAGANAPINTVLVQTDGRILAGGGFSKVNGLNRNGLVRLMTDGSLDSSFSSVAGGDNTIFALAETFLPDRRLLVGGSFLKMNGYPHPGLARLNNDGSLDSTFDPNLVVQGTVYAIAVYPTNTILAGKIVIGGNFTAVDGTPRGCIARLNPDGTLDTTFDPGNGATNAVRALAIQLDGRLLVGGSFTNFNGAPFNHIVRLNTDGSRDAGFHVGLGTDDTVSGIAIQPNNRIVLVGYFTRASDVSRNRITRLLPDGSVDPSINFGVGADNYISSVAVQPDGMLVVGGGFTQFGGLSRPHLARIYGGALTGPGSLEFTAAEYLVDEDSTNAVITVRRRGGTFGNVDVPFSTFPDTAAPGINYSNVTASLHFPAGETFQSISVPVFQDLLITNDLHVALALGGPTPPATLGSQPTATLTILNDDCAISFDSPDYSVNENVNGGLALIHVVRQGSTRRQAIVDFLTTTNGTAVPGFNYYPTNATLTFPAGEADAYATVPIIPTIGTVEGNVTVSMQLTNANHALLLGHSEAKLTINDMDKAPGKFFFAQTNYFVGEGDGFVFLTVLRTNGSSGNVSVQYHTYSTSGTGSAAPNDRYYPTNGVLSFGEGVLSKILAVQIRQETNVEGDQSFYVALAINDDSGATLLDPTNVPVTVLDDDTGVRFYPNPIFTTNESAGSIVLGVQRIGTNGVLTVNWATTNGTAVPGTDYQSAQGFLTFTNGQTFQTFSVPLLRDTAVTGPLSFNVRLFNPLVDSSVPAQISGLNPATVNINDDDPGFAFTNTTFYTVKSASNVLISVVRSNANTGIVSVHYSTTNGTAIAGIDYTNTFGTLTFSNGVSEQTFYVPLINHRAVDDDLTFQVNLDNPINISNPDIPAQLLVPHTTTVLITNDIAGIGFANPVFRVNENGGSATITVLRTGYTNSIVSVDYSTTNTVPNQNVTNNLHGTLIFTNGVTAQSFTIPIAPDNILNGDQSVDLKLTHIVGNAVFVNQAATLIIAETDGSLIKPAGVALLSERNGIANGVLDPGETVSMLFGLYNATGTNTVNLVGTLLATNGVLNPSADLPSGGAASSSYGVLTVRGPSVSRPFTFTIPSNATNGQPIAATFLLRDGSLSTNFVVFNFTVGQSTASYTNGAAITINDFDTASPYPSVIHVSGSAGLVTRATVTFTNLNHDSPSDIDALLVSPGNQKSYLMAECLNDLAVRNLTLTFDDDAGQPMPRTELPAGSYTFRPTSYYGAGLSPFPPGDTPGGPYATNMTAFNGSNPNGDWNLYIMDDMPGYDGIISNGWILRLTTANIIVSAADLGLTMTANPDTVAVSNNVTFTLSLKNYGPGGATNIVVTNPLPANVVYVGSAPSQGLASTNSAGQLVWTVPALAKDASASLNLVLQPSVLGVLSNTATVSAVTADLNPQDDTVSASVTVISQRADLAVAVIGPDAPVMLGGTFSYSIIVSNLVTDLSRASAIGVVLTNTLPNGLAFVSAVPSGYITDGNNVIFTNLGQLANGSQTSVTLMVKPLWPDTFTDTATCGSATSDPVKPNNIASAKTVVTGVPITIAHTASNLTLTWPADAGTYSLECATNLLQPQWAPVTNTVLTGNGQKMVILPIGSGNQFFRLRSLAP